MKLIVGATGLLGGMITGRLLEQGQDVRILVRHNSPSEELAKQGMATPAQALIDAGAQPVYGDLTDPASLIPAVAGVETVITTANSALRGEDDNIETVDRRGNRNLIDAARQAGVKHFVFTSAYGVSVDSPAPFAQAKAETEAILRESGMSYTILAPNIFMEIWFGILIGMPLRAGQPVTLVGTGSRKHSFVCMDDVASFALASIDNPDALNQHIAIGGPEPMSYLDAVGVFERVTGRRIPVQFVSPGESIPGVWEAVAPLAAAHDTYDSPIEMTEAARKYGVTLTSAETAVRHMLTRAAGQGGAMIARRTTNTGDLDLHYVEAAGPAPSLLLLHGILGSSESYVPLMPELAETTHVYALDLRGHGLSDRAPDGGAYRVPDYSRDVEVFLRTVVKEPAVLAGHSLGGLVAAWTAAHSPDLVRGLFLEDPPIYTVLMPAFKDTIFYVVFNQVRSLLAHHIASGASIDELARKIAPWPVAEGVTLLDQVGEEGVRIQAEEFHRFDIQALAPEIVETIWGVPDPDAVLTEVRCPAHLIAGHFDLGGAMTEEDVRRAAAAIPGCTHTIVEGVGHGIHTEKPQEYLNELRTFLARF